MRGVGQVHAIESVTLTHAEGNEGEKIAVERRNAGLFGRKSLKRQGGNQAYTALGMNRHFEEMRTATTREAVDLAMNSRPGSIKLTL
jgi:hypothetical protein